MRTHNTNTQYMNLCYAYISMDDYAGMISEFTATTSSPKSDLLL